LNTPGLFTAHLKAPEGSALHGTGTLMNLTFTGFLGRAVASPLDFNIGLGKAPCTEIVADAGNARIEICGVSNRLIELSPYTYVLKQNVPNPFNPSTQIDFSIAWDGHVLLQVFD